MSEAIRKSSEYLNTDYLNDIHSKLIGYFLENEKNPLIASEKVISLKSDIEVFLLKLTNIKDVKLSKNILEVTDWKQVYLFDLENVQNPFLWKKESVEKIKKNYSEELSKARDIISLMDIIFSKNSKEWFKELNEKDSLSQNDIDDYISYGYKVETLKKYDSKEVDLRLLQKEFLLIYSDLQKINPESLTKKQQENLLSLEESYLERALWVGNRFEGAGSYLPNDENTIFSFIDWIIKKKNVSESINYFDWISRQIFENKHKATPVMNTYVILFKKAKERIFEKMKIDGASEKDYLRFVQILRWTWIYDIDSEMRWINDELLIK